MDNPRRQTFLTAADAGSFKQGGRAEARLPLNFPPQRVRLLAGFEHNHCLNLFLKIHSTIPLRQSSVLLKGFVSQ